jgi:hypothetical protein
MVKVVYGQVTAPNGTLWTVWGKASTGKPFSFQYIQGQKLPDAEQKLVNVLQPQAGATASASQAAVVAECEGGVISFLLPYQGSGFDWTTQQTCWGDFGLQSQQSQLQRSSWRGYLGYSLWSGWSIWSGNATVTLYYSAYCHHGSGTYDYRVAAQGRALYIGTGPIAYTAGYQANCGPTL